MEEGIMFKWLKPIIGRVRSLQSNLPGRKEASSSSTPLTPTGLESQESQGLLGDQSVSPQPKGPAQVQELEPRNSTFQLSPLELYWVSFRKHDDSFAGVVICRGKSPGSAANWAIKSGLVESEKASIVAIPKSRERQFEQYQNRLLTDEEAKLLLRDLGVGVVES